MNGHSNGHGIIKVPQKFRVERYVLIRLSKIKAVSVIYLGGGEPGDIYPDWPPTPLPRNFPTTIIILEIIQ